MTADLTPEQAERFRRDFARAVAKGRIRYVHPDGKARRRRWRMRMQEEALAEAMLRPVDPAVVREMMAGIGLPSR